MNLNWSSATGSIAQEPGWQMWCCKDMGKDTKRDKHAGTIRQKGLSMAERWKGSLSIISVKGVVGCVMREGDVALMYGYVHPRSGAWKCFRTHRLNLTTVAFEGPIDKG
jgi:hypothetical protein